MGPWEEIEVEEKEGKKADGGMRKEEMDKAVRRLQREAEKGGGGDAEEVGKKRKKKRKKKMEEGEEGEGEGEEEGDDDDDDDDAEELDVAKPKRIKSGAEN